MAEEAVTDVTLLLKELERRRMLKSQTPRDQQKEGDLLGSSFPIDRISHNRVTHRGEMDSNLMCSILINL
jgi:hypothetical protein